MSEEIEQNIYQYIEIQNRNMRLVAEALKEFGLALLALSNAYAELKTQVCLLRKEIEEIKADLPPNIIE